MLGTERHARLFEVSTRTYLRLRQLWVFITRENASLASLACSMNNRVVARKRIVVGGAYGWNNLPTVWMG